MLDSNLFTPVTKAKLWCRNQATIYCAFILHFERFAHECLHRPPLQLSSHVRAKIQSERAVATVLVAKFAGKSRVRTILIGRSQPDLPLRAPGKHQAAVLV